MIILIGGASHAGKTLLAQRMLEQYRYPYLSIDHLKMGLIRSGQTSLTPMDDEALGEYLWPILREMIKTAIENRQNLIVEGCYIPFDWKKDFAPEYLSQIRYLCLILSPNYLQNHYEDVVGHANAIETRLGDDHPSLEEMIRQNGDNLRLCRQFGCDYLYMDKEYNAEQLWKEWENRI